MHVSHESFLATTLLFSFGEPQTVENETAIMPVCIQCHGKREDRLSRRIFVCQLPSNTFFLLLLFFLRVQWFLFDEVQF